MVKQLNRGISKFGKAAKWLPYTYLLNTVAESIQNFRLG